ncbi:hypothetical protein Y032_0921g3052 [Ancylostoma ceylanicum]|uniref:Uncharacterized protein n=1 Tax=Ancylostoma ceylanicum TaxID=53326 RepID=A0A016W8P3_9BILA|nr:hypothetical protein Y032_0921g3052 [Ancylostoma ceylanicum]
MAVVLAQDGQGLDGLDVGFYNVSLFVYIPLKAMRLPKHKTNKLFRLKQQPEACTIMLRFLNEKTCALSYFVV